ncbi:MAG: cell division protein ZapA [Oscillospiraceae bacterium]|nr:cell division protein ZapA [Oscillospiraceae bacterium]
MMKKVKVVICGKDYVMQTAAAPNYVYSLARTLETKITDSMDKLGVSQYNAAIMAALSSLDDLNKAQQQLQEMTQETKNYVDEAGRARMERDAAMKELENMRAKMQQLENALKLKKIAESLNTNEKS